jgi:PAS domain S-box-containing protein
MKDMGGKSEFDLVRQRAEELWKKKHSQSGQLLSEAEVSNALYELEVHQIELEIQNEELRHLWAKTEVINDKYTGLFDFTPTGYFMLSQEGKIIELNLSGANMLGKERQALKNGRFGFFLSEEASHVFNSFLKKVFYSKLKENCEVTLSNNYMVPTRVSLTGIIVGNGEQCLVTMVDITERKRAEELLVQTRHNYETFFNTIDEFLFVLDVHGNILHTNTTVINRLGYTLEELIGKSIMMVHPADRREEAAGIVFEMLNGITTCCPVPIVTKAGVQIPVETRVTLGTWDGQPAIFGVTKDISKIKLSEEKFSKLFYINPSASGLSDLSDHTYIEVNEAFCSLLGYDKTEVIGKTAIELGILNDSSSASILRQTDANGNITNAEAELKARNGEIKHVIVSSENIYIQDKQYRFTVVHDITERKIAENALRDSEEKYRTLIQHSNDPIFSFNPDETYTYVNHAFASVFGLKPEDLIGKSPHAIFPYEEAEKRLTMVRKVFRTGLKDEIEVKVVAPSGEVKYYLTMLDPVVNDQGKVLFVTCISKVFSESKHKENKM